MSPRKAKRARISEETGYSHVVKNPSNKWRKTWRLAW